MGDTMLQSHHLIHSDSFSFLAAGHPWTDQQWGTEIIFAIVFAMGSWFGLTLLYAALVGCIGTFLYLACRERGAGVEISSGLTLAGLVVAYATMSLRAQLFGAAFFSLSLWLLAQRQRRPAAALFLPLIAVAWANLHGSFFMVIVLAGFACFEDLVQSNPQTRRSLAILAACLLATLVNPFGAGVWQYSLNLTSNHVIASIASEWQATTLHTGDGVIFFVSVAGVGALLSRYGRSAAWTDLLLLGGFFALGLSAVRNELWWALIITERSAKILAARDVRISPSLQQLRIAAFALACAAFAVSMPWGLLGKPALQPGASVSSAPQGLTRAAQRYLHKGDRIFNAQQWGSWLEYALPDNPVAVDSIIEAPPAQAWSDYFDVSGAGIDWPAKLIAWNVKAVMASHDAQGALIKAMSTDRQWVLRYSDADGVLFTPA